MLGWIGSSRPRQLVAGIVLVAHAAGTALISLPLAPPGSAGFKIAVAVNPDAAETVGWPRFVDAVTAAALSPSQLRQVYARYGLDPGSFRRQAGSDLPAGDTIVLTHNYGEAGALNQAQRRESGFRVLPQVFSGQNGYGEWGPPPESATSAVVAGDFSQAQIAAWFTLTRIGSPPPSPAGQDAAVSSDDLLTSLLAALDARPDDDTLRLHVASMMLDAGRPADALGHVSRVLSGSPSDPEAISVLQKATAALSGSPAAGIAPGRDATSAPDPGVDPPAHRFDWTAAESELGDVGHPFAEPAFVEGEDAQDDDPASAYEIERPAITLADVGGMQDVKARLDIAFLTPMRNPALRKAFGKSLRGGLMLYGPPGCGKTFIARALAGELGARFTAISLADILDMWIGSSERNLHEVFRAARQAAPCVLFLDEFDALGHKRSQMRGSAQRGSVNQLLTELDGAASDNEGVFVLAASNAPWDVDPALRRPGRLDRTVLVLPPDAQAREAILRYHLSQRPVSAVDLSKLVKRTDRFSGADLAHVVETAAERALSDSVRSGEIRPITMRDLIAALAEVKPSTGAWFETARNVAEFANVNGDYDDLLAYLRQQRLL